MTGMAKGVAMMDKATKCVAPASRRPRPLPTPLASEETPTDSAKLEMCLGTLREIYGRPDGHRDQNRARCALHYCGIYLDDGGPEEDGGQ